MTQWPKQFLPIPLQIPTPPRVIEGLSGQMDRLAPTALNQIEELSSQIGKLAPTTFDEYVRDFWQRSVLFLDVLRQRGNQREEMLAHAVASVLIYESELVMRGDELPRPVNYSLLRIIPPEGAEIDDRNRTRSRRHPRAGFQLARGSASSQLSHAFQSSTTLSIRLSCSPGSR